MEDLSTRRKILAVVVASLALFAILEGVTRAFFPAPRRDVLARQHAANLYPGLPHPQEVFSTLTVDCLEWSPYEEWVVKPNLRSRYFRTNALGLRGRETTIEKPAGRFRVAVLGGSAAWGLGSTSDERSLPGRLEALLRQQHPGRDIEVINAGQPGFTSAQEVIYFQRFISRMNPDLVLLFDGYNDVDADFFNPVPDWPENALLLRSRYEDSFNPYPLRKNLVALLRHSRFLDLASRQVTESIAAARRKPAVPAIDPAATAESYARNVAALARLAAPAPVWVALQPVVATVQKPLAPEERQTLIEKEQTVAGYAARVRASYRLMVARVRAAGLPLVDLNDALGADPRLMFADECHFGDEAADRLARRIAAVLAGQLDARPRSASSSSNVRGQSSFNKRESARSASSLPPVWQRGQ